VGGLLGTVCGPSSGDRWKCTKGYLLRGSEACQYAHVENGLDAGSNAMASTCNLETCPLLA
jgi:hypothetical protein